MARRTLFFTAGLIVGIIVSWGTTIAYVSLLNVEGGSLAVPFALTAVAAGILMRQERFRWIGFGLVAGAAVETAFFVWLIAEWSRDLAGL